jgi:hypothetical protein
MRLTLRTLLAWLDDTLQPNQVREIGVQVAASPFTQELIDRIHRVSRQRRLSVPRSSGPDATDPNLVASYLDNELDPDDVAEFEKRCLTSDVNLAEVASVHQILSLLGQKVKVPPEARARMYQLVKGRETGQAKRPAGARRDAPEPVTTPIQPWVVPELPRRSWVERLGPGIACLLLIAISSYTAWRSLLAPSEPWGTPPAPAAMNKDTEIPRVRPLADAPGPDAQELEPIGPPSVTKGGEEIATGRSKPEERGDSKVAKGADSGAKPQEPAAPAVPAGSAGLLSAPDSVVLRYNADQREWVRLPASGPVAASSRLLCLDPFQATLTIGKMPFLMLGGTEVRILPQSTEAVPAIELIQGRLLLLTHPVGLVKVGLGERVVNLEAAADVGIALERLVRLEYGRILTPNPPLVIYCTKGELTATIDRKQETLTAVDALAISVGGVKRTSEESAPSWATGAPPSAGELKSREQFARMFHPNRPILAEIAQASEDESPDMRVLSIRALKSLGEMSLLMPMLSRKDDPIARRATLGAIRSYLGLGPEAAAKVRDELVEAFGEDTAAFVGKMLVGFSAEEASNPQVYEQLVAMLAPEQQSIGVRELALDTLKRLTARNDDLGYNPDHAEGKGYAAWRDLQRQGKLRAGAPRPKAK